MTEAFHDRIFLRTALDIYETAERDSKHASGSVLLRLI